MEKTFIYPNQTAFTIKKIIFKTLVFLIGAEIIFTAIERTTSPTRPNDPQDNAAAPRFKFDPRWGFTLMPNAPARFVNPGEYDLITQANALGFLDREHSLAKPAGIKRILFLGDSYVEAGQVPIAHKFFTVLESLLNQAQAPKQFEAIAMGHGAYGTTNELAVYEQLGQSMQPDLVVIVFTPDDFVNNSALLEAVRSGIHPEHAPRLFFNRDNHGGFVRQAIDPDWEKHILSPLLITAQLIQAPPAALLTRALRLSALYRCYEKTSTAIAIKTKYTNWVSKHLAILRKTQKWAAQLADWYYPDDLGLDEMFFASHMPSAFNDAYAMTTHVLALLKKLTARQHARLLLMTVESCSDNPPLGNREIMDHGYSKRVQAICKQLDIPMLELGTAYGGKRPPASMHLKMEGHWTKKGHAWVAKTLYNFIFANHLLE